MVEIRLHGPLAKDFGKVWNLDVASVHEAVQAIDANMAGFRQKIMGLAQKGMVFRIRSKSRDFCNDDVQVRLGSIERIDIIPVIAGASAGLRFVIGAVLVASVLLTGGTSLAAMSLIQSAAFGAGVSMMIGSVAEWLTPSVSKETSPAALQSWSVNGPTNTVDQGLPVPVIYGEVLTGGYAISGGISVSQIINGTTGATVSIGGTREICDMTGGAITSATLKLPLAVGIFNMQEVFTYTWSILGFTGATASLDFTNKAAIMLTLIVGAQDQDLVKTYTGTVKVVVTGFGVTGTHDAMSASDSQPVSISVDTKGPNQTTGGL